MVVTAVSPDGNADSIESLALQDDGKFIASGYMHHSSDSSTSDIAIVRYNTDGTLDSSFASSGIFINAVNNEREELYGAFAYPDSRITGVGFSSSSRYIFTLRISK